MGRTHSEANGITANLMKQKVTFEAGVRFDHQGKMEPLLIEACDQFARGKVMLADFDAGSEFLKFAQGARQDFHGQRGSKTDVQLALSAAGDRFDDLDSLLGPLKNGPGFLQKHLSGLGEA